MVCSFKAGEEKLKIMGSGDPTGLVVGIGYFGVDIMGSSI